MKKINEKTIRDFVQKHNIETLPEKPWKGGTIIPLKVCPFNSAHTEGDSKIIVSPKGNVSFKCEHNSCKKKGYKLPDFLKHYDPGFYKDNDDTKTAKESKVPKLKFVNAAELARTKLPEIHYPIEGLVPEGLSLIAAPPKSGKSWMVLDMCLSVARGTNFLNFKTERGEVVYYALEDGDKFEQERLLKVCNIDDVPENFTFVFEDVVPIDEGFTEQLDQTKAAHPNLKLIVIDTLRFVACEQKPREPLYDKDYRTGSTLKKWADKNSIAIVVVTHTTKLVHPDDALANVTGTNGLTGAVDAAFVIAKEKRTSTDAVLAVDGRRVRQAEHAIKINWDKCQWEYVGVADPEERERQRILREQEEFRASAVYKAVSTIAGRFGDGWEGGAKKFIEDSAEYGIFITDTTKEVGGMLSKTSNIVLFAKDNIRVKVIHNGTGANKYRISSWVNKSDEMVLPIELDELSEYENM